MVVSRHHRSTWKLCLLFILLGSSIAGRSSAHQHAAAPAQQHEHADHDHHHHQQQQQQPSQSYLDAYGKYTAVADRLAQLLEAEEPLLPEHVERLAAAFKKACASSSGSSSPSSPSPAYHLDVADLLQHYGKAPGVLDQRAVEQACTAIMACQLDESCSLGGGPSQAAPGASGGEGGLMPVTGMLRLVAALALFLEGLAGVYIPVLLKSVEGYEWWLSLLNCFSGGVFLAAGLVHLLPHCAESQARLAGWVGDYPLYLVLITLGYMLVLFVERVLFDVHGSTHGHGPHTGIAPPCIDCISAGAVAAEYAEHAGSQQAGSASDDDGDAGAPLLAGGDANGRVVLASSAAVAAAATTATPRSAARYNLRSRAATAAAAAAAAGDAGGLSKPLLAARHDDDGGGGGGSEHHHHHHHHHHHAGGGSGPGSHHSHSHSHQQHGGHAAHVPHHHHAMVVSGDLKQGVVLLVAMSVHTFLECMALGLMDVRKEFLMLFMAIASHKLISGLALSSRFLKEGATTRQITLCVGPFTFVAPAAILAGMFMKDVNPVLHLALSCFATGTFLYVGASEIVEEEFEGDMRSGRADISHAFARWAKFAMLLLGVAAIALLSLVPDAHDHHSHAGLGGHGHGHGHHHHH